MSTSEAQRRPAALIAVSVATVVWGLAGLFVKASTLSAVWFAAYRLYAGVVIYGVILLLTRRPLRRVVVKASLVGGVLFAADQAVAFSAFKLTTLANANIIGGLSPIVIAFAASRLFDERFGRREAMLAAVSFGGAALVAVGAAGTPAWSPAGDAFALCSVVTWSSFWLFAKRQRLRLPAIEFMAGVMIVAAIVITPLAILTHGSFAVPSEADWRLVIVAALLPGTLAHTLIAWAHQHLEAWLGALITQCMPVVAAVAAWLVLGERLTPLVVAGGLIVVGATMALAVSASRRAQHERLLLARSAVHEM